MDKPLITIVDVVETAILTGMSITYVGALLKGSQLTRALEMVRDPYWRRVYGAKDDE